MIPTARTAADHLQTVIRHWPDLADALTARQADTWPPAMGIAKLIDAEDREMAAAERAADRNPDQIGTRPTPIRIHIFDTMRAVEAALLHIADQVAAGIQRPAHPELRPAAGPLDGLGQQMRLASIADAADARRWHWNGDGRNAATAAQWLRARVAGEPGPFRALSDGHTQLIANVAAAAADRVERALDIARRTEALEYPCPHCRGELQLHGADGQLPEVSCIGCGRTWRPGDTAPAA